jgi:hypothetical protein
MMGVRRRVLLLRLRSVVLSLCRSAPLPCRSGAPPLAQGGDTRVLRPADEADDDNPIVKRKKKLDENFYGIAHVQATFNNTIVNITDVTGATLCWCDQHQLQMQRCVSLPNAMRAAAAAGLPVARPKVTEGVARSRRSPASSQRRRQLRKPC